MRKVFLPYALHCIDDGDIAEVVKVLKSDWITSGPKIREFENQISFYCNTTYGIAVNSGTAALDIAIAALELQNGEVITTPYTFVATANAILFNGLKPIFADITPDTYNISPESIRKKITSKTKAIISVDFAGQPCDEKEIREIAQEAGLYLIEDAAHALGAEYFGQKVGVFADITIFSFHPAKLITTGEGGMCVTNNQEFSMKMGKLRNHGINKDTKERYGSESSWSYDIEFLSRNYRITDFQAALGISQLKKINYFLQRRAEIARLYTEAFAGISEITVPSVKANTKHAWHIYTILLNGLDRNKFTVLMRKKNIGVNVHYIPIYAHDYYKRFKINRKAFPVTEDVFSRTVTLPLFPSMTDDDVFDVVTAAKESINELKK
jgi:UDP-4-amino-4,6-dideoxy-N-acetyl-beta-L-altrosamine transaminase